MNRRELLDKLEKTIRSEPAATLGIYGPAGSGKSHFLLTFKRHLQLYDHDCIVLGPVYATDVLDEASYLARVAGWLQEEGVLASTPDLGSVLQAASQKIFWTRLISHLDSSVRRIVILIDQADVATLGNSDLYKLMADARKFTSEWPRTALPIFTIIVGAWSPLNLREEFKKRQSSWPFLPESVFSLPDLDADEIQVLVQRALVSKVVNSIHARYLRELTSGDVGIVEWILKGMAGQQASCDTFYAVATAIIMSNDFAGALWQKLSKCSEEARSCMVDLLSGRLISRNEQSFIQEELLLHGLVRVEQVDRMQIVTLRNWLVESALRRHWLRFKGLLQGQVFENTSELIPPVRCLNSEAYNLICDVENLLRNLIMCRLGVTCKQQHPLMGINVKYDKRLSMTADQYRRSLEWQNRFGTKSHVDSHFALIGYSRTDDVLELIDHLVRAGDPVACLLEGFSTRLNEFKDIRDVVMHNQVLSERSFSILCKIRESVYAALAGR